MSMSVNRVMKRFVDSLEGISYVKEEPSYGSFEYINPLQRKQIRNTRRAIKRKQVVTLEDFLDCLDFYNDGFFEAGNYIFLDRLEDYSNEELYYKQYIKSVKIENF